MSLPAKERFIAAALTLPVELNLDGLPSKFNYKYTFKDKEKKFKKEITLTILGLSRKRDLIQVPFDEFRQYICTDDDGCIYECMIKQNNDGNYVVNALRSDRIK